MIKLADGRELYTNKEEYKKKLEQDELKSRCRDLEDSLYRMRESMVTNMRDYQARYDELEDMVDTLKDHIHALELVVEAYQNNMAVLWSVIKWKN